LFSTKELASQLCLKNLADADISEDGMALDAKSDPVMLDQAKLRRNIE